MGCREGVGIAQLTVASCQIPILDACRRCLSVAFFSGLNVNNFLTAARQPRKNSGLFFYFLFSVFPLFEHTAREEKEDNPSAATFACGFVPGHDSTGSPATAHCPGRGSNYSPPRGPCVRREGREGGQRQAHRRVWRANQQRQRRQRRGQVQR